MGNTPSSQVDEGEGTDSRASSPLPGEDGQDGYDGLPRLSSPADRDFQINFSQQPDGILTFSQPAQPVKKHKKSRKSNSRRLSDLASQEDHAEPELNDAATDDLEAIARNLKSEPESPELARGKKKKRKKAKTQMPGEDEHGHIAEAGSQGGDVDVPPLPLVPETATLPEPSSVVPEEIAALPTTETQEEAEAPPFVPTTSRKKKGKKSNSDKANGSRLDLNEDPIVGSDDDAVPASETSSRKRKSHHQLDSSSRKFKKRTSIPALSADTIESTQDNADAEALGSVEADVAPARDDFLRRSKSREPEQYEIGEDNISPSVTRRERRTRLASSRSTSAQLAEAPSIEQLPVDPSNATPEAQMGNGTPEPVAAALHGDAMDVDLFDPRLGDNLEGEQSEERRQTASDHSGDLPNYPNEDQSQPMEDVQLPQLSRHNDVMQPVPDEVDFMSSLKDDAIVALASTQPQPAADADDSVPDLVRVDENEHRDDVLPEAAGEADGTEIHATASNAKVTKRSHRRSAKAIAAAKLDSPIIAEEGNAPEAAVGEQPDMSAELGSGFDSTQPVASNLPAGDDHPEQQSGNREAQATLALPVSPVNGNAAVSGDDMQPEARSPAAETPKVERSSAHTTPRTLRTYKARQPKPSFFERSAEDTAEALAELPSNEVAATPKPTKTKAKRRLPIEVPDVEAGPSSTKRAGSSMAKAKKTSKVTTDTDTPKKAAKPRKAPDSAMRNSTGYLTGVLTKTEVAQVEGAVEAFRADHGLERHELNTIIQQNPKDPELKDTSRHDELWNRVLEACPTRPRPKLISWCRQKFHNFVARGTWTPEQDEELRQMVQKHGTKWSVIGQEINRHQKDVRDRWRNYLVAGNNLRKDKWSEDEERQFLEIVAGILNTFQNLRRKEPNNDMFKTGKTNDELVDWNVVAERMKFARSRLQCQEKWRRMREASRINGTPLVEQLESDERWRLRRARHEISLMSHADMYHVVLAITTMDAGARDDTQINWRAVLDSQRKKYQRYTAMLLWSRLRQLVPDQEGKNVQRCARELMAMYQADGGTFAVPGDEAFDEATEEALLADLPPPRKRGPSKAPRGERSSRRKSERRASTERRVISEEFVYDSGSEAGERHDDDADSSRANYNATSPVIEPEEEQGQDEEMRGADREASIDLALEPAHGDDPLLANLDPALDEVTASSPKPKKKNEENSKPQGNDENASPVAKKRKKGTSGDGVPPTVSPKKRYSGEMMLDFRANGTPSSSRKRARTDDAAGTPGASAPRSKKTKRAAAQVPVVGEEEQEEEEQEQGVGAGRDGAAASSDDEMEDIPARRPRVVE